MNIDAIIEDFEMLDDWEDRYRYVIEIGRDMTGLPEELRTADTKVSGCASQVWLVVERTVGDALIVRGDSDAHIVRGLVALVCTIYTGKNAAEAAALDPTAIFQRIGLAEHLSTQRANGLRAMVARVRSEVVRD
jgi:cysteine desulfuration protein SufE